MRKRITYKGKKSAILSDPLQIIVISFIILILVGALMLMMPFSSRDGNWTGFVDALFTSSSAVCVTGLVVEPTYLKWSMLGQIIIMLLIQFGGLGLMTVVTMIFVAAGKRITLENRILIKESFSQDTTKGMVILLKTIIYGTFIIEGIGACILAFSLYDEYGLAKSIYYGIFHSISAFCNAGFDVMGPDSLMKYCGNIPINLVIMFLIVIGGIGFTVWFEFYNFFKTGKIKKYGIRKGINHISLHSKVVLCMTGVLILGGGLLILLCEFNNPATIKNLSAREMILGSLFQSVTARTAGFNTISQSGLTDASKLITCILMLIGGSPSGTAGGIKTTVVGVLIIFLVSSVRGKNNLHAFNRKISFETLQKALSIFLLFMMTFIVTLFLLTITERNIACESSFMDILYEVTSALCTVGLTTGITPYLSVPGKIIISAAMFLGRIGPITIALALSKKQGKNINLYDYPEGKINVG